MVASHHTHTPHDSISKSAPSFLSGTMGQPLPHLVDAEKRFDVIITPTVTSCCKLFGVTMGARRWNPSIFKLSPNCVGSLARGMSSDFINPCLRPCVRAKVCTAANRQQINQALSKPKSRHIDERIYVKCKGDRELRGILHAFDQHLNL